MPSKLSWPSTAAKFLKKYATILVRRYQKLHVYGKLFIWLVVLFYIAVGVAVIIITPGRIAQYSYDRAHQISLHPLGWLALGGAMVVVSFPPLIGHTTLVTLCGFAYGIKGFFIAAAGSTVGSALAFIVLRFLFSKRVNQWSSANEKWQALESVVEAKGLPLIILIRISPFPPWVYSNSLFASIAAVKLWQFVIATTCVFPKLLLHTFIGSRIAALSDGDQRSHMDTQTKIANALLIAGGILLAILTSGLVYHLVQSHIRRLDDISPEIDELAAEAVEEYEYNEEAPLLRALSPNRLSSDS